METESSRTPHRNGESAAVAPSRTRGSLPMMGAVVSLVAVIVSSPLLAARTPVDAGTPSAAEAAATPTKMFANVSEWGVAFGTEATFAEPVIVSAPTVTAGQVEGEAWLWKVDGQDHEGEDLSSMQLPAGTPVRVEATILPPCDGSTVDVSISLVSTTADGTQVTHHYVASNTDDLAAARNQFCQHKPTVTAAMNSWSPSGEAIIGVDVINPGPDNVRVEVPAYSDEHGTWSGLSETVTAGARVRLEIHGTDVGCGPGQTSWLNGRLLLNGELFKVPPPDDGGC